MSRIISSVELLKSSAVRQLPYAERIGLNVRASSVNDAVTKISSLADSGVRQVWFTSSGSMYRDTLTLIAVAAASVDKVRLGTSIVQAYTRHPVATAQQVLAINDIAPGRFRLGLGVSHRPIIEEQYGIKMKEPLKYLREYVISLRELLYNGSSEFKGRYFNLKMKTGQMARVPILVAALGVKTFKLAGEVSDGAISWMCPISYLTEKALPAMRSGATRVGRDTPPLIAHMMVAVSEDRNAVMAAAEERVRQYARMPFYYNMFRNAGYDLGNDTSAYSKLADALTIWGSKKEIGQKIEDALKSLDEVLLMHVPVKNEEDEFSGLLQIIKQL
jgi:F420-dependent oxidoreductase-like protein